MDNLWAVYTIGSNILLRETTCVRAQAVFRDRRSRKRHTLVEGDAPLSRPSLTMHRGSIWVAWREGNKIYARAIWWGPGRTRTVYDGGTQVPTAPAIQSIKGRLVVAWAVDRNLYLSSSAYGVEWTTPLTRAHSQQIVASPALAAHKGDLFVGIGVGRFLYTIRIRVLSIKGGMRWGRICRAMRLDKSALREVSLASDGNFLSIGFASGKRINVIHSTTGYGKWTDPFEIDTVSNIGAPPALYYFNGYLYTVYQKGFFLVMKRSRNGRNWATPRFVVEKRGSRNIPTVALAGSDYSIVPPTPKVVLLHDSGRSAADVFNIVFISEGFRSTEMHEFQEAVHKTSGTFQFFNPFSRHPDKINMYRIDLPSRERGVDASPLLAAAVRQGVWSGGRFQSPVRGFQPRYTDTALGAQYWGGWAPPHENLDRPRSGPFHSPNIRVDAAEDLENPHTRMTGQKKVHIFGFYAYDLVQNLIPGFDYMRDFLYVIFNQHPEDGGYEKDSSKPTTATPGAAVGFLYVHEFGHTFASLADEEFNTCHGGVATDCEHSANKTVNADLSDPAHKWAHFFVNEGRPGDSIVANPVSRPPIRANYWNTDVVNASGIFNVGIWATNGVGSDWALTGGEIVYGPAAQCLMNHTGGTTHFCPVCTEGVVKKILASAGENFSDEDYHNTYTRVFVEYRHRHGSNPEYGKFGLIYLNGTCVSQDKYTYFWVGDYELCSVDVTSYLLDGTNHLVFHQQYGLIPTLNLLSIQVVNSNGAPLPLFPITDLSAIGSADYDSPYSWGMGSGDLEFEFTAHVSAP